MAGSTGTTQGAGYSGGQAAGAQPVRKTPQLTMAPGAVAPGMAGVTPAAPVTPPPAPQPTAQPAMPPPAPAAAPAPAQPARPMPMGAVPGQGHAYGHQPRVGFRPHPPPDAAPPAAGGGIPGVSSDGPATPAQPATPPPVAAQPQGGDDQQDYDPRRQKFAVDSGNY